MGSLIIQKIGENSYINIVRKSYADGGFLDIYNQLIIIYKKETNYEKVR